MKKLNVIPLQHNVLLIWSPLCQCDFNNFQRSLLDYRINVHHSFTSDELPKRLKVPSHQITVAKTVQRYEGLGRRGFLVIQTNLDVRKHKFSRRVVNSWKRLPEDFALPIHPPPPPPTHPTKKGPLRVELRYPPPINLFNRYSYCKKYCWLLNIVDYLVTLASGTALPKQAR